MGTSNTHVVRRGRFWLYAPYGLLLLIALAWSAGWWVIRGRVVGGLDTWIEQERAAGRVWGCPERHVGGYPFRIEVTCPSLTVDAPDATAQLGQLQVVAQIYDPSHIIAEASGPLRLQSGRTSLDATWSLLQASVHLANGTVGRGDLVSEGPHVTTTLPDGSTVPFSSRRLEIHIRPDPVDATNVDAAVDVTGAPVPALTPITGSSDPLDLSLIAMVTRARELPRRPRIADVERWREAGGRADLSRIVVAQAGRRIEGKGTVSIDEAHRPQGQFELAGQGVDEIVGRFFGGRAASAIGLIGALLGAPPPRADTQPGAARLTPLPPVRLAEGRLFVGPIATPVRLPPLY